MRCRNNLLVKRTGTPTVGQPANMQSITATAIAFLLTVTSLDSYAESSPTTGGWDGSSGTGWSSSPAGSFGGSSASGWGAVLRKNHPSASARNADFDNREHQKIEKGGHPKLERFTAWIIQQE